MIPAPVTDRQVMCRYLLDRVDMKRALRKGVAAFMLVSSDAIRQTLVLMHPSRGLSLLRGAEVLYASLGLCAISDVD